MRNILKIFFNLTLIILFLISLLILYTENISSFDNQIIHNIESELDKSLDVKSNIESVDIAWSGMKPKIFIKNLYLTGEKNQVLLKTPLSELEIDIFKSLKKRKITIGKFTINDTSINLKHDELNISFNNINLFKKSDRLNNIEVPLIVFNNSVLRFINVQTNKSEIFKIQNLIASLKDDVVRVNAKFIHNSSTEPITFIYKGNQNQNDIKSKIYLSANSIKLPYDILPQAIRQLEADRMSVRLWISMKQTSIVKIVGNISSESLNLKMNQDILNIKNINSDLLYVNNNTSNILSLMRMNYKIKEKKINNNKIVLYKNDDDDVKIFIKKSDAELLRLLTKETILKNIRPINKIINSNISNLQIHLTKKNVIDYFSLSLQELDLDYENQYFARNISADVYGTLNTGRININNLNISSNNLSLEKLSGEISYISKGKSIYFSSSNFKNKQGHNISLTGNKVSLLPSFKIQISTTLDKILKSTNYKKLLDYETSAVVQSNIYFHEGRFFTDNNIENFYLKISDSTYISSKKIQLFSSSNLISSKKFDLTFNDQNQNSKINTNINSKSYYYTLLSIGRINATTLYNIASIDKKIIDGEANIKSIVSYNYITKKISLYLSSDLDGLSLDIIKPWFKEKNEKVNFVLNYQHYPKKSYPLKINLNKNEFDFKLSKNNAYIKIKSPAARGILKYPYYDSEDNIFSGSFEYIDTNYFSSGKLINYFPSLNIQSKHVKISNTIFDNVHLVMVPKDDYIEISKLNFKNLNMEMKSKGKWFLKGKQKTEISAKLRSANFGAALKSIGYPNTIKGGKMTANIDSIWEGSLEKFTFVSSDSEIQLTIKDGQINELDKGTQAIGQVLGLLSIASIPKRLSLDFSDFFSKGLSFDQLQSEITTDSGIADINKMNIKGSFGEMRLSGESNLVERTHNQTLIFIPDLSSTSLVTGAVIGGPIGAVASIFYDRLLKEFGVDTNKLAGIEYSIKGPWDDPKIKVTQSFKPIIN